MSDGLMIASILVIIFAGIVWIYEMIEEWFEKRKKKKDAQHNKEVVKK